MDAQVSIHAFRGEGDAVVLSDGLLNTPRSFNPRLPGGRRRAARFVHLRAGRFNPRLPGGRRPATPTRMISWCKTFQSTPSGGKATAAALASFSVTAVSIHAFRGEGDNNALSPGRDLAGFNPRLPGGRRRCGRLGISASMLVSIHAFRGEGDSAIDISTS